MAQVADRAEVSAWTVSVVLNERPEMQRLTDECVERVQEAARDLGYLGNYHARTLKRGKALTLGFISNYNERDIMRPMIESGFAAEANEHSYEMLTVSSEKGEDAILRAARYVQQARIDGFAVFSGVPPTSSITEQIPPAVPLVHVWFYAGLLRPVVTVDPTPGIRQAMEHLAELGHRRIAWLGLKTPDGPGAPDRLEAFRRAAADLGLARAERFVAPEHHAEHSRSFAFYRTLRDLPDPLQGATAALCYNDPMAIGLCSALREQGLRVPDDVSVVGFDDVEAARAIPPLASVSHRFAEMGRAAVRHLHELIESGQERGDDVIRVPSRLVVRESTAAPPASNT
jgi:DNA-binding LacI/PurR family transcriptional regulator